MRPTPNDAAGELQSRLLSSLSPFEVIILVCVINTAFHPETPLHSALTSTMTSRRNRGFLLGIRRMEIISLSCYRIHLKSHSTSLALSKSRSTIHSRRLPFRCCEHSCHAAAFLRQRMSLCSRYMCHQMSPHVRSTPGS